MKLEYYEDTDSLYIHLSAQPSAESQEAAEGVVLDFDPEGYLAGIDIDQASQWVDLNELAFNRLSKAAG